MARAKKAKTDTGATVGYEAQLWQMADALRGSTLAALREALLPKLVSGELRVLDAKKITGRAA